MDQRLPRSLAERTRWLVAPEQTAHDPGDMVLYWMHNAIRGHENPALDVAATWAKQNGLALLVYHGLSENYPFASDRHHAFILQAARDVQRELGELGISYVFHLERPGHRGPHLRDLVRRAAVLVTEEMPLPPITSWLERLRSTTTTPIATVDSSCLMPGSVLEPIVKSHGIEAFACPHAYRTATLACYQRILATPYAALSIDPAPLRFDGPLDFEPMDLQDCDLGESMRHCQIDHTVGPSAETPGGSRAGYLRWKRFREESLHRYGDDRYELIDANACSRMSAYLHYGMVSPFSIARDALKADAKSFLCEMLSWREMSFHFCAAKHEHLETALALPDWAATTLAEHADDPRPSSQDWESLARGVSHDDRWNALQRSLLRHGELHHGGRMRWGKAFLPMTTTPEQAMHRCIDLNHRYAIDGRSPSSYGGILWCFGQFDRPAERETDVFGRVRTIEDTGDVSATESSELVTWMQRPIAARVPRVAIVGAGLAGLVAARTLQDHGMPVRLFEKSRGPGGRLSTRRGDGSKQFDHGAQYWTIRDDVFARYVRSWMDCGLVQPWMGRIVELRDGGASVIEKKGTARYVGVPGNNAIAKHLAADLDVVVSKQVSRLNRCAGGWELYDQHQENLGVFDVVIVNAPPAQAGALLRDHTPLAGTIDQVKMNPCWAVMLQATGLSGLPFEGAFINEGPLSWIARNDAKPGRQCPGDWECESDLASNWILHASSSWSIDHLECDAEVVANQLVDALQSSVGVSVDTIDHLAAHRWRYSIPDRSLDVGCLWDPHEGLGACGDWCSGSRVEGAFVSGAAMAGTLMRHVTIDRAPAVVSAEHSA
ncbi:MAG: FAD-dependent oxidoreductase [Planctomycetota bacterium]